VAEAALKAEQERVVAAEAAARDSEAYEVRVQIAEFDDLGSLAEQATQAGKEKGFNLMLDRPTWCIADATGCTIMQERFDPEKLDYATLPITIIFNFGRWTQRHQHLTAVALLEEIMDWAAE